jgi:hypothetical protein
VLLYSLKRPLTKGYLDVGTLARKFSRRFVSASLIIIFVAAASFGILPSDASATNQVSVSLPVNYGVNINVPATSNFSILAVTGQGYALETLHSVDSNILSFTPTNATLFSIEVNVSSTGQNYAYVTKESADSLVPACTNCNFTGEGNLVLNIMVNATGSTGQGNSSWDPLVGLLPVKIQSFSFSFVEILETLAILGFAFLGLGIAFHSRVAYLGIVVLFIDGLITLGILVVLGIISAYLLGFAIINIVWKARTWKSRRQ